LPKSDTARTKKESFFFKEGWWHTGTAPPKQTSGFNDKRFENFSEK
jgi:hypothetical protein